MAREIVYYDELHTMMWQKVTVKINEKVLKEMLSEELSEESKRELIQAYYICQLDQKIEIKKKTHYGAWNASIDNIEHIYQYEGEILNKIANNVTKEDLEKQFQIINEKILGLSEEEKSASIEVQKSFIKTVGLNPKTPKI